MKGGLFSFGSGEAGALGHGFFTGDIRAPKQVMALTDVPIVAASAGEYFSLVLSADGAIYSFGRGDKVPLCHRIIRSTDNQLTLRFGCMQGQLGHQKQKLAGYRSLTPRRVEGELLLQKVERIAAGHDHSMAITSTHFVMSNYQPADAGVPPLL
jgi:alpha-tubulin suppressor-like RCC1 family protein